MWNFRKILEPFAAKKYEGVIAGNLPANSTSWDTNDFLKAHDISLYVNRALAKRAEKVGEIEFELRNAKGDVLPPDDLTKLLRKPNGVYSGYQFWELYQKWYDIFGEAYILKDATGRSFGDKSTITALHLLFPKYVTPVFDTNGKVTKYEYKVGNTSTEYKPEQVLYIFRPDPSRPLRGQSILKAGVPAIQTEVQIAQYHSRILENGGKVEGVFKFKTPALTADQLITLKEQYKKEYADARKSGRPLFLGGDSDYVRTGLTPDELSYLEAKKTTLEDICILTGVPKSLLASFDDIQYSNAETSYRIFLRETIKPLLRSIATAIDQDMYPDDRTLTFVDPTPDNNDERLKVTESGIKNYFITINEARERHGFEPIEGGDVIMVPFSVMPLGSEQNTPADENAKHLVKSTKHPNQDPEVRRMWYKLQNKRMDKREKAFKGLLVEYFNDQARRVTDALQPTKMRVFRKEGVLDNILNVTEEVKIGKEKFLPVLKELLVEAGQDAMAFAGSEYTFNLSADIVTWIDSRTDIFLRSINETTVKELSRQFAESLSQNENREQLINRVQDTYGDINKHRAGTIARTEVHNATQNGTMEGYKQAGLTIKVWASVNDASTRETHAAQDGEERPISTPFSNGLMYPGDPRGSAEEVINCRCTI